MLRRALLLFFLLLVFFILNAFVNPIPKKNTVEGFKPNYGVSFSFEQAGWYGLEGRKSYIELLDSVEFKWVRLPFFWNQMMDENSNFNSNFEVLKWAISEAKKRNIDVIIALGAKTPYYPEYHWPESVSGKVKFGQKIDANNAAALDILEIDKKVVSELSGFDNIIFWQIENEPLLANVNGWVITPSLIKAEIEVVKGTDSKKRPVILNHVGPTLFHRGYKDLLSLLSPGDVFSVNAYFKTQGTYFLSLGAFGRKIDIAWPTWLVWPVQSWTFFSVDFENVKKE